MGATIKYPTEAIRAISDCAGVTALMQVASLVVTRPRFA